MRFGLALLLFGCGDVHVIRDWEDTELAFLLIDGETRGPYVGRPQIQLAVALQSEVAMVAWSHAMLESENAFHDPGALAQAELVRAPCARGYDGARSLIPASEGRFFTLQQDRFVETESKLAELSLSLPSRQPAAALVAVAEHEQLDGDTIRLDSSELTNAVRAGNLVVACAREALYAVETGRPYRVGDRTRVTEADLRGLGLLPFSRMVLEDVVGESEASVLVAVRQREVPDPGGAIIRASILDAGFDRFEVVALLDRPVHALARAPDGRTLGLLGGRIVGSATTAAGPYAEIDLGFDAKEVLYSGDSAQPFLIWGDGGEVVLGDVGSFESLGPVMHLGDLNGVARVDEGETVYYAADSTGGLFRYSGDGWDRLDVRLDPAIRACAGVDACGVPSISRWQAMGATRTDGRTRLLAIPAMCHSLVSIDPETGIGEVLTGSEADMLETGLGLFSVSIAPGEALVFGGETRLLRLDL